MIKNHLEVIKKIEDAGFETYIVGGFVRDYYLGKEAKDIDICTSAKQKELIKVFSDIILPKEKYGAVTLYYKGTRYEITTFRKELKYENRRPVELEYTTSFIEDIKRRDFTINSLCMNSNGETIDLFGGKKDIDDKIIRVLGDADKKFSDDPLRMLRAIRFATQLNFKLDKNVEEAIKLNSHFLMNISYDRKKEELNKIFTSINMKYGIKLLCSLKMDKYLELNNLNRIKPSTDILGIWAELDVLNKYPFSNLEKNSIKDIANILKTSRISKYEIYKYGLYNSTIAAEILGINKKTIVKLNESLPIHSRKDINITTNEVCELLNRKPNKWLKDLYMDIEYKILYSKLKNENKSIKDYIIKKY